MLQNATKSSTVTRLREQEVLKKVHPEYFDAEEVLK